MRPRAGFAVAAVLIALTMVGALLTGAYFSTLRSHRAGRDALAQWQAMNAADHGLEHAIASWDRARNITLPVGGIVGPDSVPAGPAAFALVRITRLGATTFWVVSEGSLGTRSEARRRVGRLVRLALADVPRRAAFTVRSALHVTGAALVHGTDARPLAWSAGSTCSAVAGGTAGAAAADSSRICDGTCGAAPGVRIVGAPNVLGDATLADTLATFGYGATSWRALTAGADLVIPAGTAIAPAPSVVGGACDRAAIANWGDPARLSACADHAPVVWYRGDLDLTGGTGQGMLLVDGQLTIRGPFSYAGVIVARGDVDLSALGADIHGLVLAGGLAPASLGVSRVDGTSAVRFSSCAIDRARIAAASLVPVRERAWAELF